MIATQNLAYNRPPPLLKLPTQHTTATHPAPSPTHYHSPPPTQNISPPIRLPFDWTLIPHHSMLSLKPYTTCSSSTPTQSLRLPQTSELSPPKHYPTFPRIVIPPKFHTPHLNAKDGDQRSIQMGTLRMTIIFFYGKGCTMCNNWTTWWRWWVQLQLLGANQLIPLISRNIQWLNTKKQKHKVKLISELAINENTLTITLTETHLRLLTLSIVHNT